MKIIEIEDEKIKKINKKKLTITLAISVILLIGIIIFAIYCANREFREVIDKYVLMKNIVEDSTSSISLDENENSNIYPNDKYISILSKNTLKNYDSSGKLESELTIEISTPIVATSGKYLLIAEKDKSKIYLISGDKVIWQNDLEGDINKIVVNKNGYVAVILSGTTHKSVIQTFDNEGNELFKTYLSRTTAMSIDISADNQYLAFSELNTSGTSVQSIVKIVSIQKAKQKTKDTSIEPIIYTYTDSNGELITNIKYQESNRLVYMSDNSINIIKSEENNKVLDLIEEGKKISFGDIELTNYMYRVIEKSSLLNNETSVEIVNVGSQKTSLYTLDGIAKEIYSYDNVVAINLGSEVHFISTNGWLMKKYTSSQEIKNVVICNNFAGIVYRNKVELINL